MDMTAILRIAAVACVLGMGAPAAGQHTELGMLKQLQGGVWEIRQRSPGNGTERICMQDGRRLIQLRHKGTKCERQVVADTASEVAVQYTCPGHGYGLTRIRREADGLVQIDSQGVVNDRPFSFLAEGRRVADCPS